MQRNSLRPIAYSIAKGWKELLLQDEERRRNWYEHKHHTDGSYARICHRSHQHPTSSLRICIHVRPWRSIVSIWIHQDQVAKIGPTIGRRMVSFRARGLVTQDTMLRERCSSRSKTRKNRLGCKNWGRYVPGVRTGIVPVRLGVSSLALTLCRRAS